MSGTLNLASPSAHHALSSAADGARPSSGTTNPTATVAPSAPAMPTTLAVWTPGCAARRISISDGSTRKPRSRSASPIRQV
jgi:hypothetical protein